MVLLIAGPPVEVGVTMYVLSISSVSEVLMVQFAFSNSYRIHNELSRPFHFFLLLLIHLFPCPLSPLSPFFERVPSRVYLPTPQANSPFFSSTTRSIRRPIAKGSIDRSIVSRSSAPLIPLCRLFPIVCFAIIQSARVQRTFNPEIRQISGIREIRTRRRTS